MRKTYRNKNNKEYWAKRWQDIPVDDPMKNQNAYPLKYAKMTVTRKDGPILEAGCGLGRILRYYHERGYDITGFDFVDLAIHKLKKTDSTLKVEVGDIVKLYYPDYAFKYVLAFGLYHNLEAGLDHAIAETYRVLMRDGLVCASFRADNIQTRLTDWLTAKKFGVGLEFHKMNLTRKEFVSLFVNAGFEIQKVTPVENMPILYKFSFFRAKKHKIFDENKGRKEGYRLSWFGQRLQNALIRFFPDEFCNIYVVIARRP